MKEFASPTVASSSISTPATLEVWFHCHNGVDLVGAASFVELALVSDSGTNGSAPFSIRLKDVREAARAENHRSIGMYDSTEIVLLHFDNRGVATGKLFEHSLNPGHAYDVNVHGGTFNQPIILRIVPDGDMSFLAPSSSSAEATNAARNELITTRISAASRSKSLQPQAPVKVTLPLSSSFPTFSTGATVETDDSSLNAASTTASVPRATVTTPTTTTTTRTESSSSPTTAGATADMTDPIDADATTAGATSATSSDSSTRRSITVVQCRGGHAMMPGNVEYETAIRNNQPAFLSAQRVQDVATCKAIVDQIVERFDFYNKGHVMTCSAARAKVRQRLDYRRSVDAAVAVATGTARKKESPKTVAATSTTPKKPPKTTLRRQPKQVSPPPPRATARASHSCGVPASNIPVPSDTKIPVVSGGRHCYSAGNRIYAQVLDCQRPAYLQAMGASQDAAMCRSIVDFFVEHFSFYSGDGRVLHRDSVRTKLQWELGKKEPKSPAVSTTNTTAIINNGVATVTTASSSLLKVPVVYGSRYCKCRGNSIYGQAIQKQQPAYIQAMDAGDMSTCQSLIDHFVEHFSFYLDDGGMVPLAEARRKVEIMLQSRNEYYRHVLFLEESVYSMQEQSWR